MEVSAVLRSFLEIQRGQVKTSYSIKTVCEHVNICWLAVTQSTAEVDGDGISSAGIWS